MSSKNICFIGFALVLAVSISSAASQAVDFAELLAPQPQVQDAFLTEAAVASVTEVPEPETEEAMAVPAQEERSPMAEASAVLTEIQKTEPVHEHALATVTATATSPTHLQRRRRDLGCGNSLYPILLLLLLGNGGFGGCC